MPAMTAPDRAKWQEIAKSSPIPSYGCKTVFAKFFDTPAQAEAFDAGVMAYRWGQEPPADEFGRKGWEHEELTQEKARDMFVPYQDGDFE